MKARFVKKQPDHRTVDLGNGYTDVIICVNGQEGMEETEFGKEEYIEYDYAEFRELTSRIDFDDIKTNPEKYLDYIPAKEKTVTELLHELESKTLKIDMLETQLNETQLALCEIYESVVI